MADPLTMSIISVLSMTTVLSIPAFGQLLSQKSGVYNLGIEGIMASGAVFAILGIYLGIGSYASLLLGFACGIVFGILLSILSERLKLNQIVIGFGIWFLGIGVAGSLFTLFLSGKVIGVKPISPVLLSLDPIFYLSIATWAFLLFLFKNTPYGLSIIASGENPKAADSAGVNVDKVRAICNIIGAGLMGLGGAYLAINVVQGFTYTMIAGYGWMAFAVVIFGRWNPNYVYLGSLLFATITAMSSRMEILGIRFLPANYVAVLPDIAVLVGLALAMLLTKESGMPSSLGEPYKK